MGFGAQMLAWHEDFCRALADRGRYGIQYDNRDCGLSTKFDDHPLDMGKFIAAVSSGDIPAALAMVPYRLLDMAGDGLGLLTALGESFAAGGIGRGWVKRSGESGQPLLPP
jgi:pimeloyl-ACP methyl ester carboxylesterase